MGGLLVVLFLNLTYIHMFDTRIEIVTQLSKSISIGGLQTLPNSAWSIFMGNFLLDELEGLKISTLIGWDNTGVWLESLRSLEVLFELLLKVSLPSRLHFYFEI